MSEQADDMTAQADFDAALSRVFSNVGKASKDAKGQARQGVYNYATLASVTDAISEALTAEGFSWPQLLATRVETVGEGDDRFAQIWVDVTTQLRCRGVVLESTISMPVGGNGTPQDIGSAITYGRRYGLSAAVGVCPEDDDGNAASQPRKQRDYQRRPDPQEQQQATPSEMYSELKMEVGMLCKRDGDYALASEVASADPNEPPTMGQLRTMREYLLGKQH